MTACKTKTIGGEIEEQLFQAIHEAEQAPLVGARPLPVLFGLKPRGGFTQPQENVLIQAINVLAGCGRAYVYGDTVVLHVPRLDGATGTRLVPLRSGGVVEVGAEDVLANVLICQKGEDQFPVPKWFSDVLLRCELLAEHLPCIKHFTTRPIFDSDFVLRSPGWHPEVGILSVGPEIDPILIPPGGLVGPAVERLPVHLRTLLDGFCFQSDADVANTIGLMLTGILMNHFIEMGKPVGLIDGNQPGLGKTLLVRVIGVILDEIDPRPIHYTQDDEELQKRICATLRDSRQSVLLIDNAKVRSGSVVASPAIEANSMAPEISLRILGRSENYTRPNDVLWVLTMNDTRTSPDLVSRGLPIQLAYEGKPEDRSFCGADPVPYARKHRLDILGELSGMVVRWNQKARPNGQRSHRLHKWAALIGGILETAGLTEFLANAGETAATFNTEVDELAALAEAAIEADGPYRAGPVARKASDLAAEDTRKLASTHWDRYFRKAEVRVDDLDACKSNRAKAIKIGRFFSPNVGRQAHVEVKGRTGTATLCVDECRSKEKRYFFAVNWDDEPQSASRNREKTLPGKDDGDKKETTKKKATARLKKSENVRRISAVKPITKVQSKRTKVKFGGNDEDW